jgi:aspartate kinase
MSRAHTVEKIGGTSMSRFGEVMEKVIIRGREGADVYGRVFIVSAYSGITNQLLENKKSGAPGVYARFANGQDDWEEHLETVRRTMIDCNRTFESIGLDQEKADAFVNERIDGVKSCLEDLIRVRSYGHIQRADYLPASREFLSAQGEAHSAYNSALLLQANGVNARFVDLTGWKEMEVLPLDDAIREAFTDVDPFACMPIVSGYVKCEEGIMTRFSRGYSEITFSKVAVITGAREGIIHKEYHLSTGDPVLMGTDKVQVIGNTNFDIADQMSDLDMEAIHAKAAKEMELRNIPIRVQNAFDPDHEGTLISRDYVSPTPRVEMITGRDDMLALEVFDSEMVGQCGYDLRLLGVLAEFGISYVAKNTNANTITHYVSEKTPRLDACVKRLREELPEGTIRLESVAIVSVLGSNMKAPGFLSLASQSLADAGINVLALDQCLRQVNMQFIMSRDQFEGAQLALHRMFIEGNALG